MRGEKGTGSGGSRNDKELKCEDPGPTPGGMGPSVVLAEWRTLTFWEN